MRTTSWAGSVGVNTTQTVFKYHQSCCYCPPCSYQSVQEALLPQRRDVSATIVHTAARHCIGTSCSLQYNPEQIEVMELECYSRPTCNKLCASSHDALDRRSCNPQARPSTSSVDHTVDLPRRNFLRQSSRGKYPYFW